MQKIILFYVMLRVLFIASILVLIYLLLEQYVVSPKPPSAVVEPLPTPIIRDIPNEEKFDIKKEVEKLPVELKEEKVKPKEAKKTGLATIKLLGTIYGVNEPAAMLADRKGATFSVKLGEKILKSDYKVVRIGKDSIVVEKQGKHYRINMTKK